MCAFSTGIHNQDILKRTASIVYSLCRRKDKIWRAGTELPTSLCKIVRGATLNANVVAPWSADLTTLLSSHLMRMKHSSRSQSAGQKESEGWWKSTAHWTDKESTKLCRDAEMRLVGTINPSVVCTIYSVMQRLHAVGVGCPAGLGDFWYSWQCNGTDLFGRLDEEGNRDGQEEWRT